jgi:hypothetical protein
VPLNDPPRLLDPDAKTPGFLRDALDAGRADVPSLDQMARLAQRLPIDVPPPNAPRSPPRGSTPAPLTATPSALPGAIVGAALGLAVIGLHALLSSAGSPVIAAPIAPPAIVVAASPRASTPERPRRDGAITPQSPAPVRAIAAPAISAVATADPPARAADTTEADGSIAPASVAGSPQDLPGKQGESDLSAGAPTIESETEIQLLQRAQDALGSSPSKALDLVNRHVTRFPRATLGQEREVIAIDALVRLGRVGEARTRAAAFAAQFPTSAHLRRLATIIPSTGIDSEVHKDPTLPAPTGQ